MRAGARHHQHRLHRNLVQRRVDIGFQRHALAAAQPLVGGDDDVGLRVLDAARKRLRREAGEDHGMNGADARAGEHGVGRFRDHRQVDGDAVAILDAMLFQHIGEAADLLVQLTIGDMARDGRVVALPDDRGLVGAVAQMPVDAVHGGVGGSVLEPFDRDIVRLEAGVLHLRIGRDPGQAVALLAPEPFRVVQRPRVKLLVFRLVDGGVRFPLVRRGIDFLGHERSLRGLDGPRFWRRHRRRLCFSVLINLAAKGGQIERFIRAAGSAKRSGALPHPPASNFPGGRSVGDCHSPPELW